MRTRLCDVEEKAEMLGLDLQSQNSYYMIQERLTDSGVHVTLFSGTLKECYIYLNGFIEARAGISAIATTVRNARKVDSCAEFIGFEFMRSPIKFGLRRSFGILVNGKLVKVPEMRRASSAEGFIRWMEDVGEKIDNK